MTSWLVSGLLRQFIEMCENSRCSILFHLDVPGSRWQTVMVNPVRVANAASSVLNNLVREPLEPPPPALTSRPVAVGYRSAPTLVHQRSMVATANCAVSWSVPTDTHPASAAMSY